MEKRFEKEMILRDKVMKLYLGLSLLVGISIISLIHTSFSELLLNFPLTVIFSFSPIYIFLNQKSNLSYLSLMESVEYFFLGHYLLLVGMSIELVHIGAHYMSVIPVLALMGQVLNNWTLSKKEKIDKLVVNLFVIICCFPAPYLFFKVLEFDTLSVVLISGFFIWQVSALFFTHFQLENITQKVKSIFRSSSNFQREALGSDHPLLKDRYFFHDLINHTHAMNLTLRYKLMKKVGLNHEQTKEISEQLELLQSLVRDHFGFSHKNLPNDNEVSRFSRLFYVNDTLINAFLPKSSVKSFITIKDKLEIKEKVSLPLSRWQRILTNLIKNAAEAQCSHFEMTFIFEEERLIIETKNDFYRLDHRDGELVSGLASMIKNIDSGTARGPGLGLEAIHLLAGEYGGSFDFSINEGLWCCSVELKHELVDQISQIDKSANIYKKAS